MFDKLAAPFPPARVHWRVGSTTQDKKRGMALAYVDARDVMDRLDDVCGPGGWQCRYPHANGKTVCEIGIFLSERGEWVWKADGAGDTDVEKEKGALSDAFKRAAVRWGIGRYLYDIASPWVELEAHGRSYAIKQSELPKLHRLLGGTAPAATPALAAAPIYLKLETAMRDARSVDELKDIFVTRKADVEKLTEEQRLTLRDFYVTRARSFENMAAAQ
jgi:hypothetical protein